LITSQELQCTVFNTMQVTQQIFRLKTVTTVLGELT